jgi:hypothetical protein
MLKTYIFRYDTNFGPGVIVVNAKDLEQAKQYAKIAGAWHTNDFIEMDATYEGVVYKDEDSPGF